MVERWGAFSVIDYKDARKLAAEVLLYDRLLIPTPMDWDRDRWTDEGWAPERLDNRLKQLGEIAIRANWDLDAQKNWDEKMLSLREDLRDIDNELEMTRRVLVDQARMYRPEGVSAIEAFSAYQSEADFQRHERTGPINIAKQMAEFDFWVAQRIAIPDHDDPEEALKLSLDLVAEKDFRDRRRRFHEWQHGILARGIMPKDGALDLSRLVNEYNDEVKNKSKTYRVETAILAGCLGTTALATVANLDPALFAAVGIGMLSGTQVVSIGTVAAGAVLQIAKHVGGRREPDGTTRAELSGAMFHQIEKETGWKLRGGED